MDCNSAQEQFSPYLFGALEAVDAKEIELHVDRCAQCSRTLREEGEIVAELAHTDPQLEAPARVKRRLMSRIGAETAGGGLFAGLWPRLRPGLEARLGGHLGMALASITVVVLALGGVWANGRLNEIADAKDAMARQAEVLASPRPVLQDRLLLTYTKAAPELVMEELSSTSRAADARGMFLVPKTDNSALVVGLGLARLPRNFEYRVWLIMDGRRYEGGSFAVDSTGFGYTSIEFFLPLARLDAIGVTIERRSSDGEPAGAVEEEVLRGDL